MNLIGFLPLHLGMDTTGCIQWILVSLSHLKLSDLGATRPAQWCTSSALKCRGSLCHCLPRIANSSEFGHTSMLAKMVIAGVVGGSLGQNDIWLAPIRTNQAFQTAQGAPRCK